MEGGDGVEICPKIKGDRIVGLEVYGVEWPLKNEIPIEEFPRLTESIRFLSRYVDFEVMGDPKTKEPWTREELEDFLRERSEGQRKLLRIIAEHGEIQRKTLLKAMRDRLGNPGYGARDLAGTIAGINIRVNRLGKERLFTIGRRRVSGWLAGFYEVNPRYRELLLELLPAE